MTAMQAVTDLGLTTNLVLCLDSGDSASYTSGTVWLDRSGNGYDFNFGPTHAPTFTGTAGSLNAYMAMDGSGGEFTYDTTNETWMQNIHKTSAIYTLIAVVFGVEAGEGLAGTSANTATNIGFSWLAAGDPPAPRIEIHDGSGSDALANTSGTAGAQSAYNFFGLSVNEAGGTVSFHYVNGTDDTAFDAAYTTPSASNATYTMGLAQSGNDADHVVSGRSAIFMAWSGTALTAANMDSIFALLRGRFGI